MANVLVTGGAGYIGSVVVRQLLKDGHHVRVIDNLTHGSSGIADLRKDALKFHLVPIRFDEPVVAFSDNSFEKGNSNTYGHYEFLMGDVEMLVKRYIGSFDMVVHLAAIVGEPACGRNPEEAWWINADALFPFLKTCKAAGVKKFVLASTCSVYGYSESLITETSRLNPLGVYAKSKVRAEEFVKESGLPYTILRFGTAFGWSPNMRYDLVINKITREGVLNGKFSIYGGNQVRAFVHVRDIANFVSMAVKFKAKGIVNVSGVNHTMSSAGKEIKDAIGCEMMLDADLEDCRSYMVLPTVRDPLSLREGALEIKEQLERIKNGRRKEVAREVG